MQAEVKPLSRNRKKSGNTSEIIEVPEKKNISHKNRNSCLMLKMVIFVLCLMGFGFQTMEFLNNFYKYPTVLNTAIEEMKEFPLPALTFCSQYLYDYGKYCELHRWMCEGPENIKSFCRDNPHKCHENHTDAVTPIWYPDIKGLIYFNTSKVKAFNTADEDFEGSFDGPFRYFNSLAYNTEACYRLGTGLTETGLRTLSIDRSVSKVWTRIVPSFKQRDNIYFTAEDKPFGTLFIHSPLLSFKRFTKYVTVKAGYDYQIYIRLEAEKLLPFPYKTDCEDYIASWKVNNFTGPVSREMCRYSCRYREPSFKYFENGYFEEQICYNVEKEEERLNGFCRCFYMCKDDCLKLNYHFTSFHVKNSKYKRKSIFKLMQKDNFTSEELAMTLDDDQTKIELYIESNKVRFLYHRAQYMDVELFSYIGGFLGCWLGISLWTSSGMLWKGISSLVTIVKDYQLTTRRCRIKSRKNCKTVNNNAKKEVA